MRLPLAVVVLAGCLASCAAPPPAHCTIAAVDGSGRGLPVCRAADEIPVCDAMGEMARFTGGSTSTLEGGSLALCDSSNQIVCSDRTVLPRCISRPVME
jgi:hypothetical protein